MTNILNNGLKGLLERFKREAPGTYRHCETVAELTDAVCEEIEVKSDILHLSAKFHDVGKIYNSNYFTENQLDGINPINDLDIDTAYQILSRHVSDSLSILVNYDNFPKEGLKIIAQHHGNSIIKSLAKKVNDNNYDLSKLRYKTIPPQTTEGCILMICDVVEAATRSLFTNNKLDNIAESVNMLIDDLINDCQIDHLTIGQLRKIKTILTNNITNIYHSRLSYEDGVEQDLPDDI